MKNIFDETLRQIYTFTCRDTGDNVDYRDNGDNVDKDNGDNIDNGDNGDYIDKENSYSSRPRLE